MLASGADREAAENWRRLLERMKDADEKVPVYPVGLVDAWTEELNPPMPHVPGGDL